MKYIVGLSGCRIREDEKIMLKKKEVGGVILYLRNTAFAHEDELVCFIKDIRNHCEQNVKLFVDEEGGLVSRLLRFSENWSPAYLSYLCDLGGVQGKLKVKEYLLRKSEFIHRIGVDVNLAPVVDYFPTVNDDILCRGLGYGNPWKVIELGKIWIAAHKDNGVESCLKHFPGLGRTAVDSHDDLPVIDVSLAEWEKNEELIFRELIQTGAENVMIAHAVYSKIKGGEIASLSRFWTDKLRHLSGTASVSVISDDINMGALGGVNITAKALEDAGHDYVIVKDVGNSVLAETR